MPAKNMRHKTLETLGGKERGKKREIIYQNYQIYQKEKDNLPKLSHLREKQ